MTLELFIDILAIVSFIVGGFVSFIVWFLIIGSVIIGQTKGMVIGAGVFGWLAFFIWPIAYWFLK